MKVEPIEFGFPETEPIAFTLEDKYGIDSTEWPVWAKPGYRFGIDMELDSISFGGLRVNDSIKLIFDPNLEFTIRKGDQDVYLSRDSYYQKNFVYVQRDSTVEFLSLFKPMEGSALELSARNDDEIIDLSSLKAVKSALPNSYRWRDGIPNWVAGTLYAPKDRVRLTIVPIVLFPHKGVLELQFYDDRLVYIYLKKN